MSSPDARESTSRIWRRTAATNVEGPAERHDGPSPPRPCGWQHFDRSNACHAALRRDAVQCLVEERPLLFDSRIPRIQLSHMQRENVARNEARIDAEQSDKTPRKQCCT